MNKVLVIDLDNSLLKIDLLKETLGKSLICKPWVFLKTVLIAFKNRASAKTFISKEIKINCNNLPYEIRVIDIINNFKKKGYQLVLATGLPYGNAKTIANYLGLFDKVIATGLNGNNEGANKHKAIKNEVGDDFIYLGQSSKDLPIWVNCKKAILVGDNRFLEKKLISADVEIIDIIKKEKSFIKLLFGQLRIHQWCKNILLFVPALLSYQLLSPGVFFDSLNGFIAFSLIASSIYVLNDIVDINYDRTHLIKKNRPIASGDLPILKAYGLFTICLLGGAYLSFVIGNFFLLVTGLYVLLNLLYSIKLKRTVILDVILLMTFYVLRLIAGHIPHTISLSPWLLSFSIFLFFSLGLLKRYIDIIIMQEKNVSQLSGRGYSIEDVNVLRSLGVGSGLISALVLILYTGSEQVQQFYATPMILVALVPLMLYWISRMWLMAERGKINSDPVLFAIKDKISYLVLLLAIVLLIIAKFELHIK